MDRWNDQSKLALFPYFSEEAFYAFSSGIEEGGLCPKTSNWMDDLAGSRQQDRGGTSQNIRKLTALIVFVMPIYNETKPGMYVR